MKTICLSANTSWYLYNFRKNTIRMLVEQGYQVCCFAPADPYSEKLETELGVDYLPVELDNHGTNVWRELKLIRDFYRHYKRIRPVLVCHFTIKNNVYGTLAAAALKIPAVNNVSGLGTAFINGGFMGQVARLLYRISQPFAFRVFCQNEDDRALLIEEKLIHADKLFLLPGSGVNLQRFRPRPELRTPGAVFRFAYIGRMLADKGLHELIEAFKRLASEVDNVELQLVGFSDVKNQTALSEDTLQEWNRIPNVDWLGAVDDIEDIYAQIDCLVLPSYREGMPRSVLEANAMEIPVIASDVPGCRNVVTDGFNGLICEPKDSHSLYTTLRKMLEMSAESRAELGVNGRRLVEDKYSEQVVIDAYKQAIKEAIDE